MARLLPALALTVTAAAASQTWLRVASPHFEVYTTASEKKAREIILHFEQVRAFFLTATGLEPYAGRPVRIVLFASSKDYAPYQVGEGAPAYACGALGQDEIVMGGDSAEEARFATHEYFHILMKPFRRVPLWLNEGGAEVYSTLHPVGDRVQFGDVLPGWRELLQRARWLDLNTLFATDRVSPFYTDRDKRPIFYAESWALAHMLFVSAEYRPHLAEFLRQIGSGATEAEAFENAYAKDEKALRRDLQEYARGGIEKPFVYDLKLESRAEEIQSRPATVLETKLALARVLASTRRDEEAMRIYGQLAEQYPSNPDIFSELGYFALGREHKEEAREDFSLAAERGSTDARMYYDYAAVMAEVGEREREQIAVLRKAVALDPQFHAARCRLAALLAAQDRRKGAPRAAERSLQCTSRVAAQVLDQPPVQLLPLAELEDRGVMAPPTPQRAARSVEGTLDEVDCLKDGNRIRLGVDGRPLRLLLDEQLKKLSLRCGVQQARHVVVLYDPAIDDETATVGVVRKLEFK
jgi:tetratricopeptide (TPR) repeat protein